MILLTSTCIYAYTCLLKIGTEAINAGFKIISDSLLLSGRDTVFFLKDGMRVA